jgi:hypothetical protein
VTAEAATAAMARLGQRCVAPSDRGARTRLVRAAAAHARQRSGGAVLSGAGGAIGSGAAKARRGRAGGRDMRGSCRARRCPDSVLNHAVGVACGGHVAAVCCRAGPAWRATADKRGPLVSDFRIKIYPERN